MTEHFGFVQIWESAFQALPNFLMGLAMVSGNEGLQKFAGALQMVMSIIQLFSSKGKVLFGFATGGYVSGAGTSTSDSIPVMLSTGEYVLKSSAVMQLWTGFLY